MRWEILSPLIILTWAVTLIALERLFPYDPRQRLFRSGFAVDFVWYTIVQSYALGLVIKTLLQTLDGTSGLSRLHLVSAWPVPLQLVFFWVTHDFYIYWFHRLQHASPTLWRIHESHHSGRDVDWLSGSRSHALEILINQTVEYAPIVLLGGHPDVALMKGALDATWGMYIHANLDVRAGALQYVFNGPQMHRWHHARDAVARGVNFGTKLALWDWIFGTAYLPPTKPAAYGLHGDVPFPSGYVAQTLYAFRPLDERSVAE